MTTIAFIGLGIMGARWPDTWYGRTITSSGTTAVKTAWTAGQAPAVRGRAGRRCSSRGRRHHHDGS